MKAYPSLDALKAAEVSELMALPSMNAGAARAVYAFFHEGSK
jgi:hypothetical protein